MAFVSGDDDDNELHGTKCGDKILGRGGDDTISALAGRDTVFAGPAVTTCSAVPATT